MENNYNKYYAELQRKPRHIIKLVSLEQYMGNVLRLKIKYTK